MHSDNLDPLSSDNLKDIKRLFLTRWRVKKSRNCSDGSEAINLAIALDIFAIRTDFEGLDVALLIIAEYADALSIDAVKSESPSGGWFKSKIDDDFVFAAMPAARWRLRLNSVYCGNNYPWP